ncbi:MAG: GAF domain-containing protein [Armatimonadota bacterium]|nr:GAF domain-containing protein [bacterium]MCS7309767.1 GAF domain-containing protein [Armatimonadota bacterium]MDW8290068.1 GAF domain-containing protein [Armatimonadota bacterium]
MGQPSHSCEMYDAFVRRLVQQMSLRTADSVHEMLLAEAQQQFKAVQVAVWRVETGTQQVMLLSAVPRLPSEDHLSANLLMAEVASAAKASQQRLTHLDCCYLWLHPFTTHTCETVYVASVLTTEPLSDPAQEALQAWLTLLRLSTEHLQAQASLYQVQRHNEKRLQEVTALYEIGQAMAGGSLQVLLDLITRKAAEVMEAQACSLMLLEEDTKTLVIRSSYGLPETVIEQTRVPWGHGIAGRVAASGEAMVITDPRQDPRLAGEDVPYRDDIEVSLCVPLRDNQSGVIGVLNIHRRKPAPHFTDQDLRLFSVFAMQAASAIRNAQLYRALKHRVRELSVLSELSTVVSSTLDLERILQQTADGIVETVRFDRCAIFLLDDSGKLATPRAVRGYRPETLGNTPIRVADGVIGMAVRNKELILVEDAQRSSQPVRGFGRMLGTNAFLVAPILARNRVIGVVVADNKPSARPIDQANIQLLTTFINQAGMAIENARLYHDLDRRYNELHNLWEYTRNLLSSIGVGVISIDRDEVILTWNRAAERITTIPYDRALGYKLEDLFAHFYLPQDEKEMLLELIRLPFRTGERHSRFKCAVHPYQRGEMYLNLESSPLRAPNGSVQGVVCIFEDITHEVRMEMEVQRIRQLAAVGQLASTIAHELRNPLSSIRASAQHLRSEYSGNPELCEFLDIIIDEVDTLNTRTTEFLRFARPIDPVFQEVKLPDLIHSTVQFMQSYMEEQGVRVEVEVAVPFPIQADPTQLKEALRNLIINAVQAMPKGGVLTIGAQPEPGDMVSISVRDTGVGIPPENLDRIFTPFFTTKAKGSGLGLANVQKIVESHGGTISVQSWVGAGTVFRLLLPVQPKPRSLQMEPGEEQSFLPEL